MYVEPQPPALHLTFEGPTTADGVPGHRCKNKKLKCHFLGLVQEQVRCIQGWSVVCSQETANAPPVPRPILVRFHHHLVLDALD